MADRLPNAEAASPPGWRHDWYSYEQYQVVHYSYMERLHDEGIVVRHTLSFHESEDTHGDLALVTLRGRVLCSGDLVIRVDKKMLVRRDARNRYLVKTRFYQYHAMLRGSARRARRTIVRIDNAHEDGLHRHVFNDAGDEVERVKLELDAMPTLDEFIREAVGLLLAQGSTGRRRG